MAKKVKDGSYKKGMSPGSAVFLGKKKAKKITFDVLDYSNKDFFEKSYDNFDDVMDLIKKKSVTWINVNGLHDVDKIKQIGEVFELHPLTIEDIVNTHQRAKYEEHDNYIFIVIRMLEEKGDEIHTEQLSIIFTDRCVITFQEEEGDCFDPIRERIRKSNWRIRKLGCDYLAYALIDSVVDNYYSIIATLNERSDEIEDDILKNDNVLLPIQKLKSDLIDVKKAVFPVRELLNSFIKSESKFIRSDTDIYLKDVKDHISQIIDTIDSLKDNVKNNLDVYYLNVNIKMNEVIKLLTIISTIFIPLTFIVGVYGMNFKYMPELDLRWYYPALWAFMITIGAVMFTVFRKRKWI